MPTTVHQLIEGTEVTTGASPSVTLKYFVDGAASENAALDAVLAHITSHDKVWLATGREIAQHYIDHHLDAHRSWISEGTP